MQSKMVVEIDQFDDLKLSRICKRAGVAKDDAVRLLALHGVEFFLTHVVGATKSNS